MFLVHRRFTMAGWWWLEPMDFFNDFSYGNNMDYSGLMNFEGFSHIYLECHHPKWLYNSIIFSEGLVGQPPNEMVFRSMGTPGISGWASSGRERPATDSWVAISWRNSSEEPGRKSAAERWLIPLQWERNKLWGYCWTLFDIGYFRSYISLYYYRC